VADDPASSGVVAWCVSCTLNDAGSSAAAKSHLPGHRRARMPMRLSLWDARTLVRVEGLRMALLDAFTGLVRPRRPALADGPALPDSPPDTSRAGVMASVTAEAVATAGSVGGMVATPDAAAPPDAAPPDNLEATGEEEREPTERERQMMLHLSNVSHACNHFQNQMLTMLYPFIMQDLGMTYAMIGVLSAIRSVVGSLSQGAYGFLTPFVSRCKILGYGNFGIAIGTFLSGAATGFPMLVVARSVGALGSSAQHPVGYSILSSYFPKKRAQIMAINTSASNVGTLIATPLATALLLIMGWREIFYVVAFLSVIMGVVYFMFKDYGAPNRIGSGKSRLAQGFTSYKRVLKNRNMMLIALVFMVGAAGAEGSVNHTYFAPHLMNDFGYGALVVGVLITSMNLGQIVGPIFFGRLSDRLSRVGVLQASLALSALATLWVAWITPGDVENVLVSVAAFVPWVPLGDATTVLAGQAMLFVSFFIYSAVTSSRGTLTQAIVGDTVSDADRDAAFSLYFLLGFFAQPLWLLVTGLLMDHAGFGVAVSRLSISYLIGMVLLFLVKDLAAERERTATG
jgi:MFS family permease